MNYKTLFLISSLIITNSVLALSSGLNIGKSEPDNLIEFFKDERIYYASPSTSPIKRSTYAYKSGNLLMNNSPYSAYKYESKNLFKIVQHQNSHTEHEKVDGIVETYYETGELLEKLKFDKGRLVEISAYEKNGDQSLYFKVPGEEEYTFQRPGNGSDFKITPCKYGANVSWYEIWYENGNLAKSVPYSRGVVHGIIGTYYKTGELFEKWEFDYGKPVAMIVYKKDGTRMMKYGDSSELHSRNDYASTWCPSLRFDYTNLTIKTLSDSINTLSVVSNSDLIASDLPVGVTKCEPPTCVPGVSGEFTRDFSREIMINGIPSHDHPGTGVPVTYSAISDIVVKSSLIEENDKADKLLEFYGSKNQVAKTIQVVFQEDSEELLPNGVSETFYENGNKFIESTYNHGRLERIKWFNKNGDLIYDYHDFTREVKLEEENRDYGCGSGDHYDENGNLIYSISAGCSGMSITHIYLPKDELTLNYNKDYSIDGNLLSFFDGLDDGTGEGRTYYENGALFEIIRYEDFRIIGFELYSEDSRLLLKHDFAYQKKSFNPIGEYLVPIEYDDEKFDVKFKW